MSPRVVWLSGLSGAGKTTIAHALHERWPSVVLDGDALRLGLNRNLGFSAEDRRENVRRIAEVAKLFVQHGESVIVSAITPKQEFRGLAREILGESYFEVFVDCPLEECERRDVKGLYKRARQGDLPGFTGVSDPFEKPESPELRIDTSRTTVADAVAEIQRALRLA